MENTSLEAAHTPETRYQISKSQNEYDLIGTFLSKHSNDPAIQVKSPLHYLLIDQDFILNLQNFLPQLKEHLLPRIKDVMQKGRVDQQSSENPIFIDDDDSIPGEAKQIFFKNDRLYRHRIFRINYTTYDVRRSQDVINPHTSHRDIMVIRDDSGDSESGESKGEDSSDKYLYARVLGVYHANVVYTGPGSLDYQPRRMDFLWVRWFQPAIPGGWNSRRLECIKFYPVKHKHAFGFLDPADVIRACHIIPRTAMGRLYVVNQGFSGLAKDKDDWQYYYVNR